MGRNTNAYPRGSGVSRLPISSRVIAATISSIHARSLLIVSSSARSSVSVMLQDRTTCKSSSPPSRSEVISSRAENAVQLVGGRDFQLTVAAVLRALVWTPAQELRGMSEPSPLHVVVRDL